MQRRVIIYLEEYGIHIFPHAISFVTEVTEKDKEYIHVYQPARENWYSIILTCGSKFEVDNNKYPREQFLKDMAYSVSI